MEVPTNIRPLSAYEIDQVEGGAAHVYLGPSVNIDLQTNVANIVIAGTIINRTVNIIGISIHAH
ncbi:MAG TPA: hypothetical protein VFG62_23595 [Rhodopila sp.]|nr:hypothetical protein [Rhodopila sp.]